MAGSPVAALDCGTNSTRLLVAGADGAELERLLTITRLGQGVDASGRLAPAAIERTVDALRKYREVMDRYRVGSARLVATSAARDAANFAEFSRRAREATGVEPELLSGAEEGALAFRGATAGLASQEEATAGLSNIKGTTGESDTGEKATLVVDIGGGSTELIAGVPGEDPGFVISLDMGCVRITEKFLRHDPPEAAEAEHARAEIASLLDRAQEEAIGTYRSEGFFAHRLVGVAGTVTSLCAMSLSLDDYDPAVVHHALLSRDEVKRLLSELLAETAEQRHHHRGLEAGRADVIAGGALILGTLMDTFGFDALLVSESDILDGLVASQLVTGHEGGGA